MNREQQKRETPMRGFLCSPGRRFNSLSLCVLCFFLLPIPKSHADSPPHIEKVLVGLPGVQGEQESVRSRTGAWAPVYVKLKAGPDGSGRGRFKIRVETNDTENTAYQYETPLPALVSNQDYIAVSYVRPGVAGSDYQVSLLSADGQGVAGARAITVDADKDTLGPSDVLYLTLGARLPGLKRALLGGSAPQGAPEEEPVDQKGTIRFAYIDDVAHMPDRWYGYEAADVVVLSTGGEFVKTLLDDEAAPQRRKALAEWVRHGGKLIVSVGANRQIAAEVLDKLPLPEADKMPLVNCRIEGAVTCPETTYLARWLTEGGRQVSTLRNVEFTRLIPGEGVTVLVAEAVKPGDGAKDAPLVVESSAGLGRVWLTAFDIDRDAFTGWTDGQKAFWNRVQSEFTPKAPVRQNQPGQPMPQPGMPPGMGMAKGGDETGEPPSLQAELQRSLENFEGVPVVNFGWVALFILIYIIIVGPLDYILLTRVFKRPELTWLTFPVIVISLSVLVYVVAYSMKGDDLRINKIDLVEYDLNSPQQTYGTTWFTLFSPRIQNYTFSVEPSAPAWAAPPPADTAAHAVVVAALANPDLAERAGSSSLFRKPYAYAEDAFGMERVPIPVWSTRTFQASWRAGIDAAKPPIQIDDKDPVRRDPDAADGKLLGAIRNNLPAPLQSVTIFYQGGYFAAPDLAPGQSYNVKDMWDKGKTGRPVIQWFNNSQVLAPAFDPAKNAAMAAGRQPYELMKDLMFHGRSDGSMNNSGLRPLDQSWRLDRERMQAGGQKGQGFRDELILVARTPNLSDKAETVAEDPGSATRIWLDRLPDGKSKPPALSGYLAQETFVRAYIPVQPSK
jgi:hypothetical protein